MIIVGIFRDRTGSIIRLEVKGHADYAVHGSDIVCAAASATAYTAAGSVEELARTERCYTEMSGLFILKLPENLTKEQKRITQIVLESALIGFRQIEQGYRKFLVVTEKEV